MHRGQEVGTDRYRKLTRGSSVARVHIFQALGISLATFLASWSQHCPSKPSTQLPARARDPNIVRDLSHYCVTVLVRAWVLTVPISLSLFKLIKQTNNSEKQKKDSSTLPHWEEEQRDTMTP